MLWCAVGPVLAQGGETPVVIATFPFTTTFSIYPVIYIEKRCRHSLYGVFDHPTDLCSSHFCTPAVSSPVFGGLIEQNGYLVFVQFRRYFTIAHLSFAKMRGAAVCFKGRQLMTQLQISRNISRWQLWVPGLAWCSPWPMILLFCFWYFLKYICINYTADCIT